MSDTQHDPAGFSARIEQYVVWMRVKGRSDETLETVRLRFQAFALWCEERGILRPSEVTRPIMERYQRHLFFSVNPRTNRPMGLSTQLSTLAYLRAFFRWLCRQRHILYNPAADIELPKCEKSLPPPVFSPQEAERVMNQPDVNTAVGLRDRAILETIYSSALRRSEVRRLRIDQVDFDRGILYVRKGKGGKDRVVPISERACRWVRAYLYESRPALAGPVDEGGLFLSKLGSPIGKHQLTQLVKSYIQKSGVGKKGACHIFRHTCATAMLEGGADVRYVQAMLGHANLDTTALYTRVAIGKLKDIHTATHPAAKLKPDGEGGFGGPGESAFDSPSAAG